MSSPSAAAWPWCPDMPMTPCPPAPGTVVYTDVSLRQAMNTFARSLAEAVDIPFSLPEWRPKPGTQTQVKYRPCIYVAMEPTGHTVVPLATFDGVPPEKWDRLLQAVVVPIGEASSALPFFEGRPSFDTDPGWTHSEARPAYIIPQKVVIPVFSYIQPVESFLPFDLLGSLRTYCSDALESLQRLDKAEVAAILQSYTDAVLKKTPSAPTSPQSPNSKSTSCSQFASPAGPSSPLNPRAAAFVSVLTLSGGDSSVKMSVSEILDVISSNRAPSRAQTSVQSVLQENVTPQIDDASPSSQRKPRRPAAEVDEKENIAP